MNSKGIFKEIIVSIIQYGKGNKISVVIKSGNNWNDFAMKSHRKYFDFHMEKRNKILMVIINRIAKEYSITFFNANFPFEFNEFARFHFRSGNSVIVWKLEILTENQQDFHSGGIIIISFIFYTTETETELLRKIIGIPRESPKISSAENLSIKILPVIRHIKFVTNRKRRKIL